MSFRFLVELGELYPDEYIDVRVRVTNDVESAERWAEERLSEGGRVFGLETKWWTWDQKGIYFSDSRPNPWADLALLQLATENDVLLLQPLDMPVERIGPGLRRLLKFKFLKKVSWEVVRKAQALRMCDLKFNGGTELNSVLPVYPGSSVLSVRAPICPEGMEDVQAAFLDLPAVSKLFLGLDVYAEDVVQIHWEDEYLDDNVIEVAAREAWACWALYGMVIRMNPKHIDLLAYNFVPSMIPRRTNEVILPSVVQSEKSRSEMTDISSSKASRSPSQTAFDCSLRSRRIPLQSSCTIQEWT